LAAAVTLGFAISLGVELTQRYIPFRAATYDDLVANTIGATVGAIIAFSSKKKLSDAGILVILWLLWIGFLLLPMINHAPLPAIGLDADLLWIGSISTLLGFLVLSLAIKPNAIPGAILALAPAAVLWMYPNLLLSRLAATIGAILIARLAQPQLTRLIAPACVIWLVFQELYPFDFGKPIHAFSWIPFETLFENRPQNYYPAIFEKLFFYTAVVWAMRFQGAKLFKAYSVPAVALMAGEFAQCFLPGRTPELTDPVLISVGAFMLWLTESPELCSRGQTPAGFGYQVRGAEK
jgi:VanZ family protein